MDRKDTSGIEIVLEQVEERVHAIEDQLSSLEVRVQDVEIQAAVVQRDVSVLYERTSKKVPALARVETFVTKNQNLVIALLILFSLLGGVPGVTSVLKLLIAK